MRQSVKALNEKIEQLEFIQKELLSDKVILLERKKALRDEFQDKVSLIEEKILKLEERNAEIQDIKAGIKADILKL